MGLDVEINLGLQRNYTNMSIILAPMRVILFINQWVNASPGISVRSFLSYSSIWILFHYLSLFLMIRQG